MSRVQARLVQMHHNFWIGSRGRGPLRKVLLVVAQTAGQMNAMGWSLIGLNLSFLVWIGSLPAKKDSAI